MFVGRKRELEKLNKMYHSSQFEFAVLYGRRRVGKTTLIREREQQNKDIIDAVQVILDEMKHTILIFTRRQLWAERKLIIKQLY